MYCSVYIDATNHYYSLDVDKCALDVMNDCHEHANCLNDGTTYKCECKTGFQGNGTVCHGKNFIFSFSSANIRYNWGTVCLSNPLPVRDCLQTMSELETGTDRFPLLGAI